MIHSVRRTFVAFPLALLLAGCSGNDHAAFRPASAAALPAPATGQAAARGSSVQPVDVLGYKGAPASRYDITLDEIREHVQNNTAVFIDARGTADFALGHVRGALNVPAGQKEAYMGKISKSVATSELIILYCNGPHCDSGDMVYEYLAPQGFSNMRVFKPGWQMLTKSSDLR